MSISGSDNQTRARNQLLLVSQELEAIRPEADMVMPAPDGTPDSPIQQAWKIALDRFRDACKEYVRAFG